MIVQLLTFGLCPLPFQQCNTFIPLSTYGTVCMIAKSLCLEKYLSSPSSSKKVQDHVQPNQTKRYKIAVSTAIWLQLTLVACYLRFIIVAALTSYRGLSSSLCYPWIYTGVLVFLHSSLNPILYCWKIEEVRQAVKNTIRQVLCLCFSS